jgi:hypothetical protein
LSRGVGVLSEREWLPSQDSNLGPRIQSPLCYHCTTRHQKWCRRSGSNRHGSCPPTVFETVASACSATSAIVLGASQVAVFYCITGGGARYAGKHAVGGGEISGRRDSNPRPSPWQGDALPLSHFRIKLTKWCRGPELNWGHLDFQSSALPTELPRQGELRELF